MRSLFKKKKKFFFLSQNVQSGMHTNIDLRLDSLRIK